MGIFLNIAKVILKSKKYNLLIIYIFLTLRGGGGGGGGGVQPKFL